MKKKHLILIVLSLCVLGRLIVSPLPINEDLTTGGDQGGYLHFAWFMKEHPGEMWDSYWYAGMTATSRFYPPGIFFIQAILANVLSDIISFKLVLLLSFVLAPIAFYYMVKEFELSEKQRALSTIIFTFAMIYNVSFYFGKTSAISSVLFGLIFFKFFIRSLKNKNNVDIVMSSIFLSLTVLTHSVVAVMYIGLVAIYFAAVLFVKFDMKKMLRGLLIYVSGFILSAYWIIPAMLEKKYSYFLIFSETEQSFFNIFPFAGIVRTFGYYVNLFTIFMALIALVLICYGFVFEYQAYKKKKNAESLFLILSSFIFVIGYFVGFYFIKDAILAPEASVILFPIFLSIIITKGIKKRVLNYLTITLVIFLLISFFGTPMQMQSKEYYSRFDGALTYLQGKDGRVSFQPFVPYKMVTVVAYRAALFGKEIELGNFPQSMPPNRNKYIHQNFGFSCIEKQSALERIFSVDFLKREYIKSKTCELINPNLEDYFYSMNVHYIIVGREFPEVMNYFENSTQYQNVYMDSATVVYNFTKNPQYLRAETDLSFTYSRSPDKVIIDLHSDSRHEDLDVWISESWHPHWVSNDVQNIGADENGFITFTVPEIEEDKRIVLEYKTPEFYCYLPLLTLFWLSMLILNVKLGFLRLYSK